METSTIVSTEPVYLKPFPTQPVDAEPYWYTDIARQLTKQQQAQNAFGKETPVVTNERGGKNSDPGGRYDLIPGEALTRLAQVLGAGAQKYGDENWKNDLTSTHINHALLHLAALLHQDPAVRRADDHLGHALSRLAMAVWAEANVTPTTTTSTLEKVTLY